MSDQVKYARRGPKSISPDEVQPFSPVEFGRDENLGPLPEINPDFSKDVKKGPPPDPFEVFPAKVKAAPDELMASLPSLDSLFQPFDLFSEQAEQSVFSEMVDQSVLPEEYVFEDMETRDPVLVEGIRQAKEESLRLVRDAEEKAAILRQAAETESSALVDEAAGRADALRAQAEEESESLVARAKAEAEGIVGAARAFEADLQREREEAREAKVKADEVVAATSARVAGLEDERRAMEEEIAGRKTAMEEEHSRLMADIESTRQGLMEAARKEGHEKGFEHGLKEGHERGYEDALNEFRQEVEGFLPIVEKLDHLYEDLWQANGPLMIKLAIEAVEQILNKKLNDGEELAASTLEGCISFLARAHRVTIVANPHDIEQLEKARGDQRARLGALVKVSFVPDESLGSGDLIVESDVGRLDATVKHRAAQVLEAMRNGFKETYGDWDKPEEDIIDAEIVDDKSESQTPAEPDELLADNASIEDTAAEQEAGATISGPETAGDVPAASVAEEVNMDAGANAGEAGASSDNEEPEEQ